MERKNHRWAGIIVFTSLWLCSFINPFFEKITISSILLPIVWSVIPDKDHRDMGSHRNIWWHSITIPLFIFYFNPGIIWVLTSLSAGLHCLLDIRLKKTGGFYTLKYYKMKSIDGYWFATISYIGNFILSVIILIWYLSI